MPQARTTFASTTRPFNVFNPCTSATRTRAPERHVSGLGASQAARGTICAYHETAKFVAECVHARRRAAPQCLGVACDNGVARAGSGDEMNIGVGRANHCFGDEQFAVPPPPIVCRTVTAITQLGADIDGEAAGDESGWSVAMNSDGTIVAVGAVYNDATGTNAGHVRVYQLSSNSWSQLGNDFDGEAAGDMSGISVALSSDGSILAVGAWYNSDGGSYAGQVRVFQWSSGSWAQLGSDIDGGSGIQTLGRSVALSSDGTVLATGAIYNSNPPNNAGVVRVLQFSSNSWTQLGSDIVGEAADDNSGGSVSLNSDGTIVAIGAQYNDGTGSNAGHVRVHQFSSGSWTQLGGDIDGEAASDEFGQTVSLNSDGTILAVGTQLNDGNGANAGHVQFTNSLVGHGLSWVLTSTARRQATRWHFCLAELGRDDPRRRSKTRRQWAVRGSCARVRVVRRFVDAAHQRSRWRGSGRSVWLCCCFEWLCEPPSGRRN